MVATVHDGGAGVGVGDLDADGGDGGDDAKDARTTGLSLARNTGLV